MSVLYDSPREVGPDRIADAVAAYERVEGRRHRRRFRHRNDVQLRLAEGRIPRRRDRARRAGRARCAPRARGEAFARRALEPPHVLGRNTPHALQSGAIHGSAALVDGLVARLEAELGFPCAVIATGGLASAIAKHAKSIGSVEADLTLEGLRILLRAQRRSAQTRRRCRPRRRAKRRTRSRVNERA